MCNSYDTDDYDDTYQRNYCDSFGDPSGFRVISCADSQLIETSYDTPTLDWAEQYLLDGAALGEWKCDADFLPKVANRYTLGDGSFNWQGIYLDIEGGVYFDNNGMPTYTEQEIYNSSGNYVIDFEDQTLHDGAIGSWACNTDFVPYADGSFDLGEFPGGQWKDLYLSGVMYVGADQVVGARGATVSDPTAVSGTATNGGYGFVSAAEFNTAITNINTNKAAIDSLISRLQAHGLIA